MQTSNGNSGENNLIFQTGLGGADDQEVYGMEQNDKMVQLGGPGNDEQNSYGSDGDDIIGQQGNGDDDDLDAEGQLGNDHISQYGGSGMDGLYANGGPGYDYINQDGSGDDDEITGDGDGLLGTEILQSNGAAQAYNDLIKQRGGSGNDDLIGIGGPDSDKIVQQGESGNDLLEACGDICLNNFQDIITQQPNGNGTEDDFISQEGGPGNDILIADAGNGNDVTIQSGGDGNDGITNGSGIVEVFASPLSNSVNGPFDNDLSLISGGSGNDSIIYNVGPETDRVFIDCGLGYDIVDIFENGWGVIVFRNGVIIYSSGTFLDTVIETFNCEEVNIVGGM